MKEFLTNPHLVKDLRLHLKDIEEKFDNQKIFMAVEEILENIIQKKNA